MTGDYEDRPSAAEFAEEDFWNAKRSYPRGYGPPWQGEDAPSEYGDPLYVDDEAPSEDLIPDPGFAEDEDAGHYLDYGPEENDWEHFRAYQG